MKKRVGILGGTFDPPHLGHLIIAEEARIALQLEEVWFIPTYSPPHKNAATTAPEDRVNMLELATEGNPAFMVNTIELERRGKSFTFDTLSLLKRQHPELEFYFIIGADMVEYLPKWHRVDDLFDMVQFAGVGRPGYRLETEYPVLKVEVPLFDISSSQLRKMLSSGRTVKYMVPDKVKCYIEENRLYEKR